MKFILTRELGRLARWLRILGLDTVYFRADNYSRLLIKSLREERIIVTRDRKLFKRYATKVVLIKKEKLEEQLREFIEKLNFKPEKEMMFSRCIICNQELKEVSKEEVRDRVPLYVFKTHKEFMECKECRKVYWQGSHWGNVKEVISKVLNCGFIFAFYLVSG